MANNDVVIISVLVAFFLVMGLVIPYINQEFSSSVSSPDTSGLTASPEESGCEWKLIQVGTTWTLVCIEDEDVSMSEVILSILTVFVWNITGLGTTFNLILNLILMIPRFALVFVIFRNIWIGGGS